MCFLSFRFAPLPDDFPSPVLISSISGLNLICGLLDVAVDFVGVADDEVDEVVVVDDCDIDCN